MAENRAYTMKFNETYPLYVNKAERKGRTKEEVNEILCWLTGYTQEALQEKIQEPITMEAFFTEAPAPNPKRNLITGSICGVKIAEIEKPIMKEIRYLDKLVDELAKGKAMDKILRT